MVKEKGILVTICRLVILADPETQAEGAVQQVKMPERYVHGPFQHNEGVESCKTLHYVSAEAGLLQYFVYQVLEEMEAITGELGLGLLSGLLDGGFLGLLPEMEHFSYGLAGTFHLVVEFDSEQEVFRCHEGSIASVETQQ